MKTKILLLFILIMLCVGTSAFAMSYDTFMEFMDEFQTMAYQKNNLRTYYGIQNLKNNNIFSDVLFTDGADRMGAGNTFSVTISNSTADSSGVTSVVVYCYKIPEDAIFYKDGTRLMTTKYSKLYSNLAATMNLISFQVNSSGVVTNLQKGVNSSAITNIPFTDGFTNNSRVCFVNEYYKQIYTDSTGQTPITEYYYLQNYTGNQTPPPPTWTFTKYNNLKLNYSVNEMPLGTFSGDVNPKDLNYIWVDYTTQQTIYNSFDYTGMYPSIYNRGMSLFIYNRLLKDHEYDLYIYKDNEDTQQFHYIYIYTSGDTGWNGQDTTNNIIDNNNQQYDDNTKQPNLNDYKISGDSIISSLGVTFSGDPYDNVWFMLINGFSESLTSDDSLRQWTLSLPGNTNYIIDLDVIHNSIPDNVRTILTLVSSAFLTIKMLKWVKIISDLVSSGNIDEVLEDNSEERHN